MAQLTRTWWGQKFIAALEAFTDPARLGRGRSYARGGRITSWSIDGGRATAKVRGSINPYFGVYKEPTYTTTVQLKPISQQQWDRLIRHIGSRAGLVTRLLLNELPESIEDVGRELDLRLLPANAQEFATQCSCPDWANPCKHVAGVCYLLAGRLDEDPLLLFELRGLSRQQLHAALLETPLGKALAASLAEEDSPDPVPVDSYHTRPQRTAGPVGYSEFWTGGPLPAGPEPAPPGLAAVPVRKAGAWPPFWNCDYPFIEAMAEFYERVRKANADGL